MYFIFQNAPDAPKHDWWMFDDIYYDQCCKHKEEARPEKNQSTNLANNSDWDSEGFQGNAPQSFGPPLCSVPTLVWPTVAISACGRCFPSCCSLSSTLLLCFWWLASTMLNKNRMCVMIKAISSWELFCQNIIPTFLILKLATDCQKQRLPICKISKGQKKVNILVFAASREAAGGDVIAETQPVEAQFRKITRRNNNNRKSNQETYEMWKNNINCIHERQIYCSYLPLSLFDLAFSSRGRRI